MAEEGKSTCVYIASDLPKIMPGYFRKANCRSRSEFINKAIRHYIAYLQKEADNEFLTPALESVLSGLIGDTEGRLSRVLFKLAVEISMLLHVTASQSDISEQEIAGLRKFCMDEVKKVGGNISFERAYRHQKG
jgi:metal-responsive CopG/Arc/MetJ family transcriptional regulator